ncbi:ATP-binding protein [Streptomyces sp. NPDC057908]|uniref:ATP-binding protein n=1 Tax=Streptomyces sp. NPDC057908 TaxID=3346276 RepID=UPI0036E715A0
MHRDGLPAFPPFYVGRQRPRDAVLLPLPPALAPGKASKLQVKGCLRGRRKPGPRALQPDRIGDDIIPDWQASTTARYRARVGATRAPAHEGLGSGPPLPPGTSVCVIEVADDGPGIHTDEAPRVFDRFYQATPLDPPTETGPEPGSGLGLPIAAAIAAAHSGRLELDNRRGEGCAFRLLLPDPTTAPKDDTDEAHHRPSHT